MRLRVLAVCVGIVAGIVACPTAVKGETCPKGSAVWERYYGAVPQYWCVPSAVAQCMGEALKGLTRSGAACGADAECDELERRLRRRCELKAQHSRERETFRATLRGEL